MYESNTNISKTNLTTGEGTLTFSIKSACGLRYVRCDSKENPIKYIKTKIKEDKKKKIWICFFYAHHR
jgi:hypothetical protein